MLLVHILAWRLNISSNKTDLKTRPHNKWKNSPQNYFHFTKLCGLPHFLPRPSNIFTKIYLPYLWNFATLCTGVESCVNCCNLCWYSTVTNCVNLCWYTGGCKEAPHWCIHLCLRNRPDMNTVRRTFMIMRIIITMMMVTTTMKMIMMRWWVVMNVNLDLREQLPWRLIDSHHLFLHLEAEGDDANDYHQAG